MLRRKKAPKNGTSQPPELFLTTVEGDPIIAFPKETIHPIRRFISRLGRKEVIPERLSFFSALRREGVSYISLAFATTMAFDLEVSVCLVDLNWFWPSEVFTSLYGRSDGLGAVLCNQEPLDNVILKTAKSNLTLLPAGDIPVNERAYFSRSSILRDTMIELNRRYDHVILDIPSILASNDSIPLASLGTATCLVIQQGATIIGEVKSAMNDLDHIPNLGVIMNKYRFDIPEILLKLVNPFNHHA